MKTTLPWKTALCCLLSAGVAAPAPAQPAPGLTQAAELARIYDSVLGARFDLAARQIASACPAAPRPACLALDGARLWWRILMDPASTALDGALARAVQEAVGSARAWTEREPQRAEAWFYLAAARAPLVQWRALRGQPLAAAREGSRVKSELERALELDPRLHDARFGIGLYRYYADVAPAAFRMFRWLLLLPGGNRTEGLQEMLRARENGALLRGEADYQLHWLYLWYEDDPDRALELVQGLDARYPTNPLFLKRIAEIHRGYFGDRPASAEAWRTLVGRASAMEVEIRGIAEVQARLGLADELDAMFQTDRAIEELTAVVRLNPRRPHGALARAYLRLGQAHARLGHDARAAEAYQDSVRAAPADETGAAIARQARAGLETRTAPETAEAYRLSLDGLRAIERGAAREAVTMLARSVALNRHDPSARHRYARSLRAAGDSARAREQLELVAESSAAPPFVRADAFVDLAVLLEASGETARAADLYRRARDTRGGTARARHEAQAALARLEN